MSNKVGRPAKYKTPEAMQKAIDEYFDTCDNRIRHVFNKKLDQPVEMIDPEPYTIQGLALALGFESRQSLFDYINRSAEFSDIVKRAKLRVENDVTIRSFEGNAAGPIFNLKNNFGHRDKQEIEQNVTLSIADQIKKEWGDD